jgi:glyoxylase-like metal-dependent hydrolase (beta-lactamase superfamily II)
MEKAFQDEKMAALRPYLPTSVFREKTELAFSGTAVGLFAFGPAHTGGDTVVLFPAERVAFIGDLAFAGRDPLIHRSKGGTSFGLVKTLRSILELEADIFVPGHGKPLAKSDIEELRRTIEDKQAKVKDLLSQGKSLEEVKAAFGIAAEAPGGRRWPSLVEVIYLELTERK